MASQICKTLTNTLWRFPLKQSSRFLIPGLTDRQVRTIIDLNRKFHTSLCLEDVTQVKMPSLSPTMTEGTIVKWSKTEGEPIAAGDVLCEIQTDKAVVSLEFDDDGILAKILMPENSADVKVGALIALVVGEGEDWKNVEIPKTDAPPAESSTAPSQPSKAVSAPSSSSSSHQTKGGSGLLGPAVKTLLTHYGLTPSQVEGSGPKGAILKGDILQLVAGKNLQPVKQEAESTQSKGQSGGKAPKKGGTPQSAASYTDIEVTNMRRTIAKRLLQSKSTIAHVYGIADCSIERVMQLRKEMQSVGIKVSVNDFIIKVVGNTLSKCPYINVAWEGTTLVQKPAVDISVAVATDNGLITPIVTNVAEKDVIQISEQVKALAAKARAGKLQPHEFMGGSFSISNLGMFGIYHFTAIINPPQCAILAVGGGHTVIGKNGKPVSTVKFTLSYDASAISEEEASKFLANLKHEVENASEISLGIYNIQSRLESIALSASN